MKRLRLTIWRSVGRAYDNAICLEEDVQVFKSFSLGQLERLTKIRISLVKSSQILVECS